MTKEPGSLSLASAPDSMKDGEGSQTDLEGRRLVRAARSSTKRLAVPLTIIDLYFGRLQRSGTYTYPVVRMSRYCGL